MAYTSMISRGKKMAFRRVYRQIAVFYCNIKVNYMRIIYRPSVKNEGVWDIGVLNWKIFNLFFIFWLAIAE